ncbi:MAG: hypothetical protein IKI82_06365 [Lachnospiraceae bacterium]|nr:hypothetical protein [Lachnospiraceae bacterium]
MKKRTIFIELTSLLDVILIMIFVLLTQARAQTTEAIDDAAADRAALKEIRRELKDEQAAAASREESLKAEIGALESKAADLETQVEELGRQLLTEDLVMDNSLVLTISVAADTSILLEVREGRASASPTTGTTAPTRSTACAASFTSSWGWLKSGRSSWSSSTTGPRSIMRNTKRSCRWCRERNWKPRRKRSC